MSKIEQNVDLLKSPVQILVVCSRSQPELLLAIPSPPHTWNKYWGGIDIRGHQPAAYHYPPPSPPAEGLARGPATESAAASPLPPPPHQIGRGQSSYGFTWPGHHSLCWPTRPSHPTSIPRVYGCVLLGQAGLGDVQWWRKLCLLHLAFHYCPGC
jgi:hypothetical protein